MRIVNKQFAKFTDAEAEARMRLCVDLMKGDASDLQREIVRIALDQFFSVTDYRGTWLEPVDKLCVDLGRPVHKLYMNDSYKRYLGLTHKEEHPLRRFDRARLLQHILDEKQVDAHNLGLEMFFRVPVEADIIPLRKRVAEAEAAKKRKKRAGAKIDKVDARVEKQAEVRVNPVADKYLIRRLQREVTRLRSLTNKTDAMEMIQSTVMPLEQENIELRKLLGRMMHWGLSQENQVIALHYKKQPTYHQPDIDLEYVRGVAEHGHVVKPTQAYVENPLPLSASRYEISLDRFDRWKSTHPSDEVVH